MKSVDNTELLKKHGLYIFHHSIAYNQEDDDVCLAEVPYIAPSIFNDDYAGYIREKTYWFCEDDDMKTLSEILNMTVEDVMKLEDHDGPRNVGRLWLELYKDDREWCDSVTEIEVLEFASLVSAILSNPDLVAHILKQRESKNGLTI